MTAAEWRHFLLVSGLAILVALFGEPQPFSIIVAGIGWLAAAIFAARRLDRGKPKRKPR